MSPQAEEGTSATTRQRIGKLENTLYLQCLPVYQTRWDSVPILWSRLHRSVLFDAAELRRVLDMVADDGRL
jgi:hypothetical protein